MTNDTSGNQEQSFPLTNLNEQLLAFVKIANAMLGATDLDQVLKAITKEVARLVKFDRSSVTVLSQDKQKLVLKNIHKEGTAQKFGEGRQILIDPNSVIGWVAIHNRPLLRNDIRNDDKFSEIVGEEELRSDIIVPLTARGRLIGTLNVGSRRKNAFTDTDLEVLTNCGKFASLAIEHTMLRLEAQDLGERYQALQENANDIIMLINRNTGRLVEVNRKCESAFGYERDELSKRSFFDLFASEDQYQARRDFIDILSQKSETFVDRRMISRDGNIIYVDINANLITLKDEMFIQMIVHNVSQRRMLEQQIIRQNKNLQDVNTKLTQVDQMKTEFLANISHELRTPLSVIIAYAESLRDKELSDDNREEFLNVIRENGGNLLTLINNLLDLSKLEISGQKLHLTLSHVHDVVKSVWPQMVKRAQRNDINVTFLPGSIVPVTYFDNNQIMQVLSCLVQNAIKFTDKGGSVTVKTRSREKEIWVQVTDTGTGIREGEIDSIFDTFHQVDGSSSRKWGGLGIGLALAKHIMELHKGKLWVESEYGTGSTFTMSLPLDTEEAFLRIPTTHEGVVTATMEPEVEEDEDTTPGQVEPPAIEPETKPEHEKKKRKKPVGVKKIKKEESRPKPEPEEAPQT